MENFMEFLPGYQLLVSLHFIAISLSVKTWWKHETRNKLEVPNTTKMFKIPKIIHFFQGDSSANAQLTIVGFEGKSHDKRKPHFCKF